MNFFFGPKKEKNLAPKKGEEDAKILRSRLQSLAEENDSLRQLYSEQTENAKHNKNLLSILNTLQI